LNHFTVPVIRSDMLLASFRQTQKKGSGAGRLGSPPDGQKHNDYRSMLAESRRPSASNEYCLASYNLGYYAKTEIGSRGIFARISRGKWVYSSPLRRAMSAAWVRFSAWSL